MTAVELAAALPDPTTLRERSRALAVLDTIVSGQSEYAYYHLDEPAFGLDGILLATVCLWRETGDDRWHAGDVTFPQHDDPDGSNWMFDTLLDHTGAEYADFAVSYYERPVEAAAVTEFWESRQLTTELVRRLNPSVTTAGLAADLAAMGWPPRP